MKSYVIKTKAPMISDREIYEGANTDEAYEAFVKAHAASNASDLDNEWFHIEEALRAAKETAEIKEAKYSLSSAEAADLRDLVSKTVTTLEDNDDNTAANSLRKAAGELITSHGTPDMFAALADQLCPLTGWIDEANEGDERNDAEIFIQELAEKLIKLVFEDLKLDFYIPDS